MLQSGSKILYHHVDYGIDHCHWSHRKRKLRYTPRNPPSRFLCLELLHLSSLHLTAPPTPTLFGVFAFQHRRSPFITCVCTPSIRCLCNSSLSILACIGKVFAYYLHQEHKRLPVVQLLHSLCSELHLRTLLFLAPVVSFQYLVESYEYSCTISVCLCAISVLQISPYSLLMFDSSSSCHNTYPSQNRVPIFIPLLHFSSIIRVFINSPIEKSQSPNLTALEKSPLHHILEHTKPNCSFVPLSC